MHAQEALQVLVLALVLVRSTPTALTSCATTPSSSSCDRLYSSSLTCSSPFCNKLARVTLSWRK